jgi:PPK2 family polyphosphate:nucleotide phosphotransferase
MTTTLKTRDNSFDRYRVAPGAKVNLAKYDPQDSHAFSKDKKAAHKALEDFDQELDALQELLYAGHKHKILIVLEGMDTSGKDGVIRHVFRGVNPQGVKVSSFKQPTAQELDHDFLWRIHPGVPGKGEIVIFNRSHYEDILVARVHGLVPEKIIENRYDNINNFEKMLVDEGATILKFFLHISKDEQKERLEERLRDKSKHWKFSASDVKERKFWDAYIKAYELALSHTSTTYAPWYVVPANKKWYRNLVTASVIVDTLKGFKMHFPQVDLKDVKIED